MSRLRLVATGFSLCAMFLLTACEGAWDPSGSAASALDSDGDGIADEDEVAAGTNPADPDTDHDGLLDGQEISLYGTSPTSADSDGDGLSDLEEVRVFNSDPWNTDTDGDGLPDGTERNLGTSPTNPDHDGGGVSDGAEVAAGTDPHWAGDDGGTGPTGPCWGQCNDGNPCTEDACDPADGSCSHTAIDEGLPCFSGGTCLSGQCRWPTCQPSWCNDGNPCTEDFCDPGPFGSCAHADLADDTACPGGTCQSGECRGSGSGGGLCNGQCNDGNPCTEDLCNPADGSCSYADANEGGTCFGGGTCFSGTCRWPTCQPEWCNDGNPCTDDFCDGGAFGSCAHSDLADDTACPGGTCQAGVCLGGGGGGPCYGQCEDGNPCTADLCDPVDGSCAHAAINEGASCYGGGTCVAGACLWPTCMPAWCNDGNPCTDDFCAGGAFGACAHANLSDGVPCPGGSCEAGSCQGPGGGGLCTGQCEDGNPCTADICNPADGSCTHAPVNEGMSCWGPGTCVAGTCSFEDVGPRIEDAICSQCNDGNPCTMDFCLEDGTCTHDPGNEGIKCATGMTCQSGTCAAASCILEECDDGNPCTEDSCDTGTCQHANAADGGSCFLSSAAPGERTGACQAGACVPRSCSESACGALADPCLAASCPDGPLGACGPLVPTNEGMPCGDGGAVCTGGVCVMAACDPSKCDDLDPCTENTCNDDGECAYPDMPEGTPCGDGGTCAGGPGSCTAAINIGTNGTDYGAGETECNGLDDNGDGKIDEGNVCPYPVHQFAGPELILSEGGFTGGHAYMFITTSTNPQVTWFEAKAMCEVYGYHLVFINSPAEGQFVHEWIYNLTDVFGYINADTWIGGRREPGSAEWGWQDGLDPWGYEDFSGFVFNPTDSYNYDNFGACTYFGDHEKPHWDVSPCSYHRSVVCEAGPPTPDGVPLQPTDYIRGKCLYDYDGNEDFGAGYSICAFVQMNEGEQPGDLPSYLRAFAEAKGFARLFGHDLTILGVMANAEATYTTAFAEAKLTVLGADVFSLRLAAELEIDPLWSMEVTFVEMSKTFLVGFIPITLSASLEGELGIKLLATAGIAGIAITPTPYARVFAAGAAVVGIDGVGLGVHIELTLIGLDIPVEVALVIPNRDRLDWSVDIDLDVHTLDGEVFFSIEIGPLEIKFTIFEWDGFHWVFDLYDKAGSIYF